LKIRTLDPYFSFTESPQKTDIQNNSDSENEEESVPEDPNLDKIEQIHDPNIT